MRQNELAERVGVSSNYLSLIENERREPTISLLRKLAEELDVPITFFFLEEVEREKDPEKRELLQRFKELLFKLQHLMAES
ncbi:MAG: helix-turn-helix transcriptional regulator [Candidatus Brocadiales bacterium]|nr:helix-turn-helix transcriptional regulator [Candidatus Bathyanammoxibius sp.]